MRASKRAAVAAGLVLAAVAFALFLPGPDGAVVDGSEDTMRATDAPYEWAFDGRQDMQLPELPTGCEATAVGTLLRMNGVPVTKFQVADAMPKSDSDFVACFLGDPYSPKGWACMAPCGARTANRFLETEGRLAAVELTGTDLGELPLPCAVWATIGMDDPVPSGRVKDGYELMQNPHCVVVTSVDEGVVSMVDPLEGIAQCDRAAFERIYEAMGRQSVWITDLDEALRIIRERGLQ